MVYIILKIVLSASIIVAIAEVAKRSSFMGGLLASLPLISILAMIWIYTETKDVEKISQFSMSIFWLVIPSLTLFAALPLLLKKGLNFYLSLGIAALITIMAYYAMIWVLGKIGIEL